ncbi:hypothetical protein THRCLA_22587 [Thraustotheca clavata]|uniref:Uncharacterized protein n=1 Tax=Thraustotheca clavata TaxID=74557 RepID=A0A1V9YWI5_9STRA|nr:hypothetical protein THRCLA_22587 [Thraustotheca clavata]
MSWASYVRKAQAHEAHEKKKKLMKMLELLSPYIEALAIFHKSCKDHFNVELISVVKNKELNDK